MSIQTTARHATLEDLAKLLESQQAMKHDAVVPATNIRSVNGLLHVQGMTVSGDPIIVRPTEIMDGHIAAKLGIPVTYLRQLRDGKQDKGKLVTPARPDLYDANVNGWLHGGMGQVAEVDGGGLAAAVYHADPRRFLIRTFADVDGTEGVGRALMSDQFKIMDNFDILTAALEGVRDAGVTIDVTDVNLSERRMQVRVACPEIAALAPVLLGGYKPQTGEWVPDNPTLASLVKHYPASHLGWDASAGEQPPLIFAGFDIRNSETGGSKFTIVPVFTVKACKNGVVVNALAVSETHLGGKLDTGIVKYEDDTQQHNVELIRLKTRDTVKTFTSPEFIQAQVAEIEAQAGKPVEQPVEAVEMVGKKLAYTEEQTKGVLDFFIKGGQLTSGGVLNAVTSYAQTIESPDVAADLEATALQAMQLVAA